MQLSKTRLPQLRNDKDSKIELLHNRIEQNQKGCGNELEIERGLTVRASLMAIGALAAAMVARI